MVEQSGTERTVVRHGTYIEELREFFPSRGVHFGSPEDLAEFAGRVATAGPFQEEMQSLVRSIQFREADNLGRGEMLELVVLAVGGPAVDTAAQEMHSAVRQIFVFVNEALRQRRWELPEEPEESREREVTVSNILATSPGRPAEERTVGGRTSGNGLYDDTRSGRSNATGHQETEREHGSGGMLFKAVSMAEEDSSFPSYGGSDGSPLRRPWVLPVAAAALLLAGGAVYLGRTVGSHPGTVGSGAAAGVAQTQAQPITAASCVAPSTTGPTRSRLENRMRWAHGLLDQKMYEAALPELRAVAQMDPSYPGINLDQSDALLQLKRPEDARDAVDTQIGISNCLSKLPSNALDAYCSAEFSPSTVGGCRAQLSHIRQAAELQAALVHLELGHQAAPDTGAPPEPALTDAVRKAAPDAAPPARATVVSPPVRVQQAHRAAPLPPATDEDNAEPPALARSAAAKTAVAKPERKSGGDDALRRGEGTDSAYGAYSRPQEEQ